MNNRYFSNNCNQHSNVHSAIYFTYTIQIRKKDIKWNIFQDYCLHIVVNGIPHALEPNECPQLVKTDLLTQFPANSFYFSYQRRKEDAKPFEKIADDVTTVVHQSSDMLIAVTDKDGTAVNEKSQSKAVIAILAFHYLGFAPLSWKKSVFARRCEQWWFQNIWC